MSYWLARGFAQVPLFVSLVALAASCSSSTSTRDAVGAGASSSAGAKSGAGASSSSGGATSSSGGAGQTYVPPTCDQGCQDYLVSWALNDTIWFLWNQKLAGRPVGAQDIMGACPLGGTVHITGMDSVANGTTTSDIQFELTGCENSN